jgi:hypothetical protein
MTCYHYQYLAILNNTSYIRKLRLKIEKAAYIKFLVYRASRTNQDNSELLATERFKYVACYANLELLLIF